MDDISSVLGHDLLGALQDNTITEDTTTLCTEKPRKRSIKNKKKSNPPEQVDEGIEGIEELDDEDHPNTQFGFENIVFDIDNRCNGDPEQPIRYCSLAQFVEGNDIARKSFKRPKQKSASINKLKQQQNQLLGDTIEIQIQGSHIDLSDTRPTIPTITTTDTASSLTASSLTTTATTVVTASEVKHISFQEDTKSGDEQPKIPKFNIIVEPPSPVINDELRAQRISEYRRHSSHAPSLHPRQYEKEKDRRHSGYNPNLLGLDSEHMRFLNCSPAASRRISSGSLFKVSLILIDI